MTVLEKLGLNMKKRREQIDMTQEEVAEKADMSANYYAKIERGEVNTSILKIMKIIKALKSKSSDILPF